MEQFISYRRKGGPGLDGGVFPISCTPRSQPKPLLLLRFVWPRLHVSSSIGCFQCRRISRAKEYSLCMALFHSTLPIRHCFFRILCVASIISIITSLVRFAECCRFSAARMLRSVAFDWDFQAGRSAGVELSTTHVNHWIEFSGAINMKLVSRGRFLWRSSRIAFARLIQRAPVVAMSHHVRHCNRGNMVLQKVSHYLFSLLVKAYGHWGHGHLFIESECI